MKNILCLLLTALQLSACALLEKQHRELPASVLGLLSPGQSTTGEVTAKLGSPNMKVSLPDNETAWIYLNKESKSTRLSIIFDTPKSVIKSIHWFASSTDPEVQLNTAKKQFANDTFTAASSSWINPHASPDEVIYNNADSTVHIALRKSRNEVSAISKSDGSAVADRKPASKFEL
ncbi:hypothetical protein AZI85_05830 [Bdellovibrio bacteriovorus]|uniref:Lipoprotein n=1 Tax=Bdellovibrio bacteriovorus TaxID=959 RepID=A0A150WFK3_BDEBC|nr:hypothetical protein [Bdellovibrio bacteriovorus]KYG61744.1 hypothetical protein AZI85_05830 [Bdellovibrio bacteriovorus]